MGIIYGGENHSNGSFGPKTRMQVLIRSATGPVQNTCPDQNMGPDQITGPDQKMSPDQKTGPDHNTGQEQITGPDRLGYRCHIHIRWCFVVLSISFVQIISSGHMNNYVSVKCAGGGVPYRGSNRMSPQTSSGEESGKQGFQAHQELECLKNIRVAWFFGSLASFV